jgi:histidinol-phosphate aminotransferase
MKKLIKDNVFSIENYEPGPPIEVLQRNLGLRGDFSKLASNENPLGPSPLAVKAMANYLGQSHLYPDTSCYLLKEKLAEHLHLPQKNLCVGNGSTELIYLIGIAFLNAEETLIMSECSFIMGKIIAQIMGANLVQVPLKEYGHDFDSLLEAISPETKIVYLDNPMNPIGSMKGREEIVQFMERVPDDVLVVFDEAYFEYVDRVDFPDSLSYVREGRNVIVLRTFSKMYGLAGLRVGYCAAKEEFIKALKQVSPPFSVNRLAQVGAVEALEDKDHIQASREINQQGKNFLWRYFEKMSVFYIPSVTNFVTVDVKTDAVQIAEALKKEGVIVRPLTMYGRPTYLRVTIGTETQNQRFTDAFGPIYQSCQ